MSLFEKFFLSLAFFTRLPIPQSWQGKQELAPATVFFPLAGLTVGLSTLLLAYFSRKYVGNEISFVLAFLLPILISGGIHLDGVADSADGLFYAGTKTKRLEIMRDTQLGVYGVLAIVVDLLIRFYATFLIWNHSRYFWLVALVPVVGKIGVLFLLGFGESPEEASLSTGLANKTNLVPALLWSVVMVAFYFCPQLEWSLLFFSLAVMYISVWAYKKVGCACGDLCGFANETWELVFMLGLVSSF